MRVVLVTPPLAEYYVENADEPLHLEYLAGAVRSLCEVFIVDGFGRRLDVERITEEVRRLAPDIVGISLTFSGAYATTTELCRRIKALAPGILIMLGGNTATFLADKLITNPCVDVIFRGEAEISFPQVVRALEAGETLDSIPGITYNTPGGITQNDDAPLIKNLDTLPFPARDLLPHKQTYNRIILATRGCSYGCLYCSAAAFWKSRVRMRSPENVLEEIDYLRNSGNFSSFSFSDDCFTLSPERVIRICAGMRRMKLQAYWGGSGRIETITKDLLKAMRHAGCHSLFFGIESGSRRILQNLNRRYTPDDVIRVYRDCLSCGIRPSFSFIVGLPYETPQDLGDTFRLIRKLKGVESGIHILTPFPGTPLCANPDDYGLTIHSHKIEDLEINTRSFVETSELTIKEIQNAYRNGIGYAVDALRYTASRRECSGEEE